MTIRVGERAGIASRLVSGHGDTLGPGFAGVLDNLVDAGVGLRCHVE
jgi:hypothetical protein